jgi:hypothetical protein
MKKQILSKILQLLKKWPFLIFFFTATVIYPETYYVATDGLDSNPGTHVLPWETFEHAFSTMSGGDTTIIKNGSYDQQIISYYGSGIPVGTEEAYTLIKAENDWGVEVSQELRLSPASFIHIQGIHFLSEGLLQVLIILRS